MTEALNSVPTTADLSPARLRVAPSPTGDPHVGTAYMALFDKAWARRTAGAFVLRIEDTDQARLVPGSEQQIYDTLEWLGLGPDEGPQQGGDFGPYRQSERLETYRPFVEQLIADGHAYYCWCSSERLKEMREQQQAEKRDVIGYDRLCLGKSKEERAQLPGFQETPVVRMLIPDDVELTFDDLINGPTSAPRPDDQVILKTDGFPTYHLAVVVDDHLMGITHVVRGQEWISSTPKHLLLYRWLGLPAPRFAHMPLIRNTDRSKISKRKNPAARLTWFREQGYLPEALLNFLMLLGYPPVRDGEEVQSFDDFVAAFDWSKINPAGPIFDMDKLNWLNAHYIRTMPAADLAARIERYWAEHDQPELDDKARELLVGATPLIQERLTMLSEAQEKLAFLFAEDASISAPDAVVAKLTDDAPRVLDAAISVLEGLEPFDAETIQAALRAKLVDELGIKPKFAFAPVRVGITGSNVSPPLFESMELLRHNSSIRRLKAFRATL
ncbi:glutamate--tRNA ligase [Luteococcus sp. H138]|uniref:glutamate--tRNA ligase n=1 Tax=unclassified Luteococcus TaxID=2639923 RepID=UPI00313B3020